MQRRARRSTHPLYVMTTSFDGIRSCDNLYLGSLEEPGVNELRVVLLEARSGKPLSEAELALESDPALRSVLTGGRRIEHLQSHRRFEIYWSSYIGYSVVNESFSNGEPKTSKGVGKGFVEYSESQYLEYLSRATFATADYPGPYRHWAIYCLDHTIDIASQAEPVVREVMTSDTSLERAREK
jgi:hypothetical protein